MHYSDHYMYIASTGQWYERAPIPSPAGVSRASAWTMGGKGYVYDSALNFSGPSGQLYSYDPAIDQWDSLSMGPWNTADYTRAFVVDSLAYIVHRFGDMYSYDAGSDTWASKAAAPAGFSILGANNNGYSLAPQGAFFKYDVPSNSWLQLASAPFSDIDHTGFSIDGMLYYTLGRDPFNAWLLSDSVYRYDPALDQWSVETNLYAGPLVSRPISFSMADRGYICGGQFMGTNNCTPQLWSTSSLSTVQPELETGGFEIGYNPARNLIEFNRRAEGKFSYSVYSPTGKLINSGSRSGDHIALQSLTSGVYLVTVQTTDDMLSLRFFVP